MDDSDIIPHRNEYLISDNMLPVRKHQAQEEIMQLEREFAGLVYFQRNLEKD